MKQSIVKEAKMSEYNGKKSYTATFEDGVTGYYDAKTIGELKQGDHVLYTAEEKTNKKGGKYNLLTIATPVTKDTPYTPKPTQSSKDITPTEVMILKERFESAREAMRQTMKAVCEDKIEWDKVGESFKLVNTTLQEAIDDICKE